MLLHHNQSAKDFVNDSLWHRTYKLRNKHVVNFHNAGIVRKVIFGAKIFNFYKIFPLVIRKLISVDPRLDTIRNSNIHFNYFFFQMSTVIHLHVTANEPAY